MDLLSSILLGVPRDERYKSPMKIEIYMSREYFDNLILYWNQALGQCPI